MEESQIFQAGDFEVKSQDLKPLEFDDIDLFVGIEENKSQAIKGMVSKTLKRAYPEIKDEQVSKLSLKDTLELSKIIMKLNGFEDLKSEV